MSERVAAVVLAGGRSSRFGRDKLAEPIMGRPMLAHVLDRVGSIADVIVVVTAAGGEPDVPTGIRVIHDERPFEGPLAGLAAGLRAVDLGIERIVVVGGDMPTLVPAVLDRLIDGVDRRAAAVLADDDGPRPLPMAVRRSVALPEVERLIDAGERRLRALLETLDVEVIAPETWRRDDPAGDTLRDVDVPDDLPS